VKTFDYELEETLEYGVGGNVAQGSKIHFYAPKAKQRKKTGQLKQMFFRALPTDGNSEDVQQGKEDDVTGEMILFLIAQSDQDYTDFIEIGKTLICDGNAKIDDIEKFTAGHAELVTIDDLEQMVGEYVAHFIVRSALNSIKNA